MNRLKLACTVAIFSAIIVFDGESPAIPASARIINVEWKLNSFEILGGKIVEVAPAEKYTIQFKANLTVIGQSDCNNYSARYVITDNKSLTIKTLTNTEAACSPTSRCWEFLDSLKAASSYELRKKQLKLYYDKGKKVLNFSAD